MAIQFECPHCQATVRCGDGAAGKIARCPQCRNRLQVPSPGPLHEPQVAAKVPEADQAADSAVEFTPPVDMDATVEMPLEDLPLPEAVPAVRDATSRRSRRRRRRHRDRRRRSFPLGVIVPIVLGLLLVGGVSYFVWQRQHAFQGSVTAEMQPHVSLPPVVMPQSQLPVPETLAETVIDSLRDQPYALTSDLMRVVFGGESRGLTIHVEPSSSVYPYRVNVREDARFRQWIADHAEQLQQEHEAAVAAAGEAFLHDWNRVLKRQAGGEVMIPYRDAFGLLLLCGPVGSRLVASHGGVDYPCVYEDGQQQLYFLLPKGVRSFEIIGREMPDGKRQFYGRLSVTVTTPEPAPADADRASPADSQSEPAGDSTPADEPAMDEPSDADNEAEETSSTSAVEPEAK